MSDSYFIANPFIGLEVSSGVIILAAFVSVGLIFARGKKTGTLKSLVFPILALLTLGGIWVYLLTSCFIPFLLVESSYFYMAILLQSVPTLLYEVTFMDATVHTFG